MNTEQTQVFCRDCKWFRERKLDPTFVPLCLHPESLHRTDLVTGNGIYKPAKLMRKLGEPCSIRGKLFEPCVQHSVWTTIKKWFGKT